MIQPPIASSDFICKLHTKFAEHDFYIVYLQSPSLERIVATMNFLCTSTPQAISLFPDIMPLQFATRADENIPVVNCHSRSATHLGAQEVWLLLLDWI